jgi:hypothetical protein
MTDRTHATLRVELDPQDGSIAGRLLDGEGAGRSFSGWVGLAAAIEDALQGGAGRGTAEHADETAARRSRTGGRAAT